MLDKVLNTPVIMEVCLRSLQYLESLGSSVVFFFGGGGEKGGGGLSFFIILGLRQRGSMDLFPKRGYA